MYGLICLLIVIGAEDGTGPEVVIRFKPIYSREPGHAWDILHESFFVRRFTTGETYYHRFSFTAPWLRFTSFVKHEDNYKATMSRLDAVERLPREQMEETAPVRRFLFFRDLWTVFESINSTTEREGNYQARRGEIQSRLARIMRRLELSEREIATLPNTLSLLRTEATFPGSFDPKAPDRPFLPTNLLDNDSDWVSSRINKRLAVSAPAHERSVNQRSLFSIHLLAAGGREAGEALLATANKSGGTIEFPPGTVLVLLRRAIAGSTEGKLVATNVVESLQSIVTPLGDARQDFRQKFVLDRSDLVQGQAGLRRMTGKSPLDAFSFESTGQWARDPQHDDDGEVLVLGKAKGPAGIPSLNHCVACHGPRTHQYYANMGPSGSIPTTNRDLTRHIETAKAASDDWREYLRLRSAP